MCTSIVAVHANHAAETVQQHCQCFRESNDRCGVPTAGTAHPSKHLPHCTPFASSTTTAACADTQETSSVLTCRCCCKRSMPACGPLQQQPRHVGCFWQSPALTSALLLLTAALLFYPLCQVIQQGLVHKHILLSRLQVQYSTHTRGHSVKGRHCVRC